MDQPDPEVEAGNPAVQLCRGFIMTSLMKMGAEQIEDKFGIYFSVDLKEPEELWRQRMRKSSVLRLTPKVFELASGYWCHLLRIGILGEENTFFLFSFTFLVEVGDW